MQMREWPLLKNISQEVELLAYALSICGGVIWENAKKEMHLIWSHMKEAICAILWVQKFGPPAATILVPSAGVVLVGYERWAWAEEHDKNAFNIHLTKFTADPGDEVEIVSLPLLNLAN
ncbi:hypothetical protein Ancab_038666 [Ancistrocladus abbreviatus]